MLFLVLAAFAIPAWAANPPLLAPMQSLRYFVGHWDCAGQFPASGRKIASRMHFELDLGGAALTKHHADKPPSGYRDIEAWGYDARDHSYQATVFDNSGSARHMTSGGWKGESLTWSVVSPKGPRQQFVYVRMGPDTFRVDWKIARPGHALVVGDTLTCRRR